MRLRMTLGFAVFIALILSILCWRIDKASRFKAEARAAHLLNGAANRLTYEIIQEHQIDLHDFLAEERSFTQAPLSILVLDQYGKLVKSSGGTVPQDMANDSENWRTVRHQTGSYTLILGFPWKYTNQALDRQADALIWLATVSTLVGSLAAWVVVGRVLRPIHLLSQQARKARLLESPSVDREMRELVETLNGLMLTRGRFYAAASHELRTPLQGLLGHLELALAKPRTTEYYEKTLREVYGQTRRLTDLVRALLMLNQLEVSAPPLEMVELNTVLESQLRNRSLGTRSLDVKGKGVVQAPLAHLEMLIGNLLDNAIKYSPDGSNLELRLSPEKFILCNQTRETVSWDSQRLFEPFYRPDQSRTSSTGGNGLGLAICKSIAGVNNWQIKLESGEKKVCALICFFKQD